MKQGLVQTDLLGLWRPVRGCGSGGFSDVFVVDAVRESRSAAMKVFRSDLDGDLERAEQTWRAFRHEVHVLRRIQGHKAVPD